jgi:hypothetical protein
MLRGVLFDSDNRDHDMTIYNAGRADVPRTVAGPRSDPGPHVLAGTIPGFVLKFPVLRWS